MQWLVTHNGEETLVDLPQTLPEDRPVAAKIGEQSVTIQWQRRLGILSVIYEGVPYVLKVRHHQCQMFPGDSQASVNLEMYDSASRKMITAQTTVEAHVPGAANRRAAAASAGKQVRSPMTGKVLVVDVEDGQAVKPGQTLLIIEAMKMENKIAAPAAGIVRDLKVTAGQSVTVGSELCHIAGEETP